MPYVCNQGIGIPMTDESLACSCSPRYFGEKCQFHNNLVSLMLQLNFSESIREKSNDSTIELKLLVHFLVETYEIIQIDKFHVRPALGKLISRKRVHHLLYSRPNQSIEHHQSTSLLYSNRRIPDELRMLVFVFLLVQTNLDDIFVSLNDNFVQVSTNSVQIATDSIVR
jgi:hypothetical protein